MLERVSKGHGDLSVDFQLVLKPQQNSIIYEQFEKESPPYSIGVDGYVAGLTRKDVLAPRAAFDHHHANRLYTRNTAAQIWMEIRQGLVEVFRDESGVCKFIAYASNCDEDDSSSILLLREPHLVMRDTRRRLEKLIDLMDKIDTTCATYPMNLSDPDVQAVFWITDPYREAAQTKVLEKKDPKTYQDIIDQIGLRIKRYIAGTHRRQKADTRFDLLHRGEGWAMINEKGKQARIGAIADGHKAIISTRELANGNHGYVFTRISDNINYFDLPFFVDQLKQVDLYKHWGGGDTVIGSDKEYGSSIEPAQMIELVEDMIVASRKQLRTKRNGSSKSKLVTAGWSG